MIDADYDAIEQKLRALRWVDQDPSNQLLTEAANAIADLRGRLAEAELERDAAFIKGDWMSAWDIIDSGRCIDCPPDERWGRCVNRGRYDHWVMLGPRGYGAHDFLRRATEEAANLRRRALSPEAWAAVEAWLRCDDGLRSEVLTTLRAQRSRPDLAAVEDEAADLLQAFELSRPHG